jgi:membrane peptidoglycan carboxypeptidase
MGRRASTADGPADSWQDDAGGRTGYRGARRSGARTAAGLSAAGQDSWSGRTAVRDADAGWADDAVGTSRLPPGRGGPGAGGRGPGRRGGGGRGGWDGPPPTRGQRFKRWLLYGDWWRHWTWKKALAVLGCAMAGFFLLGIGTFFLLYSMTPIPTAASEAANWQSSNVYLANGQLLGTFANNGQTRELLTSNQIPKVMTDAITAIEDHNFYNEGGISVTGLMRATYQDVLGGGSLQGGSTITMQYAKNYYAGVNSGQNITTKLKEIFIAMKLARTRSKSWVMTNYLNVVPFGPTENGLWAAAERYFGVNLARGQSLSLAQAAMLAAMPNAPGYLSPDPSAGAGYTALVSRWHTVLADMVQYGDISQAQADAQKFPKIAKSNALAGWTGVQGYLMQMVEQELTAPKAYGGVGLTDQQLSTGGYKIVTTFNMAEVKALAKSVNEIKAQIQAASGSRFPSYDRIGAVLENPKNGAIEAIYGGPGWLSNAKQCQKYNCDINMAESAQQVGSSFKPYVLSTAVNEKMSVFSSRLDGYGHIYIPNAPADTSATELAKSLFSPPAGATNVNPSGFYLNQTHYYHFPGAAEPGYGRPLPVNVAAAESSDPGFEDLLHRAGFQATINMAKAFGVGSNPFVDPCLMSTVDQAATYADTLAECNDMTGPGWFKDKNHWFVGNGLDAMYSPSTKDHGSSGRAAYQAGDPGTPQMSLGQSPLTPVEQATTFATLADHGLFHSPHVIASVSQGSRQISLNLKTRQVMSPAAAADVDWALSFDNNMAGGTAMGTVTFRPGGIIAKTGTLGQGQNSSQAWFNGATPMQDSLSVALFTNFSGRQFLNNLPSTPSGMRGSLGGAWPATIWNNFMTKEFGGQSWKPVNQVFPTVNGYPFVPWIQVKVAPKKPTCRPGPFCQSCQGNGHGNGNGNKCPTPAPSSCSVIPGVPCSSTSPGPSPTCGFGPCQTSPAPSPSPTPTCSGPPGNQTCTTSPVAGTTGAVATAAARASPSLLLMLACEDPTAMSGGVPLLTGPGPLVT